MDLLCFFIATSANALFDRPVRARAVTKRNNYNFGGETQSILSKLSIKVGGNIYNLIIFDNKIE